MQNYQGGLDTIGPVEVLRAELRSPVGTPPPARCAGCQRCGVSVLQAVSFMAACSARVASSVELT